MLEIFHTMTLSQMVEAVRGRGFDTGEVRGGPSPLEVEFHRTRNCRDVYVALRRMTFDQQAVFMRRFLDRWYIAAKPDDNSGGVQEIDCLLGPAHDKDGPNAAEARPLLFILTADGQELSAWFGIPSLLIGNEVRGEYGGCLFTAKGRDDSQAPYRLVHHKLEHMKPWGLEEVMLPCKARLFYPGVYRG